MPAPQQNLLSPGVSITWLNSISRRLSVVLVVFLTVVVPLSAPSTSPKTTSNNYNSKTSNHPLLHPHHLPPVLPTPEPLLSTQALRGTYPLPDDKPSCPEVTRWPIFCSALMNTSILNETSRATIRLRVIEAQDMFCDMIRVLNKIDCAQPFTVSPRWRLGCQVRATIYEYELSLCLPSVLPHTLPHARDLHLNTYMESYMQSSRGYFSRV